MGFDLNSEEILNHSTTDMRLIDAISPIELLASQHREIEDLLAQIESLDESSLMEREELFNLLAEKIQIHTELEEKFFYPELKEVEASKILASYEEHDAVCGILKKIRTVGFDDANFTDRMNVLKEIMLQHLREEENELFPRWEAELDSETLARLGAKMQMILQMLTSSGTTGKIRHVLGHCLTH